MTATQFLCYLATAVVTLCLVKFVRHRRFYGQLPGPPRSFLWGHLKLYGDTLALFPPLSHFQVVITTLAHKYNLPGLFYVDLWPFGPIQLVITDPELASHYITAGNLPKHPLQAAYLDPILGEGSIIVTNGPRWKRLHNTLAPAFSTAHVLSMTSLIANDVKTFYEVLLTQADAGKPFRLEDKISALSFDIIFKAIFGYSANAQTEQGCPDLQHLDIIVHSEMMSRETWNPLKKRQLVQTRKATAKMLNESIEGKIRARFSSLQRSNVDLSGKRGLGILDLILRERIQQAKETSKSAELDADFMEMAIANIKSLMLAGSGTTAHTLCFAYMLLSANPDVIEKIRQEHRDVYSSDVNETLSLLHDDPIRLNKLDYTTSVIKETLRIYPIGNTGRAPDPPGFITYKGKQYPALKHMIVCPVQHTWQMNPNVFPNPDSFEPERFSNMDKATQLAWRPFERGTRQCLGQSLAMEEMKMTLLLTVQYFNFHCDSLKPNAAPRVPWTKMDLIFGDRAFPEFYTDAKPRDGMSMTVTKAKLG
ncbi:cytochrome P450 3A30 [Lophiotrema nucula]|uniref:Cytochrome P450 3A30 n=1 Tax=Lophiotrema nucula TaxID=690887 RepID=A0A6A5ZA17_9PLEO|nr:cytochrome P450 3A30 [Lophiotrema nucula]